MTDAPDPRHRSLNEVDLTQDFVAADFGLDEDMQIPETVFLDRPLDGVPPVTDTPGGLRHAIEQIGAASGPIAVDTERASGIRYDQRPFLIQVRRGDSPTFLIDPEAFEDLAPLNQAMSHEEWIIHACTQDLPSLQMRGLHPDALFDTELASRLAGYPRVSLGVMTEELLGYRLAKEHSAADWSQRPLPESWLAYAALDVELLVDLREALAEVLKQQGKLDWALEEFRYLLEKPEKEHKDPWRRTKGIHQVRSRRQLTALRNLWVERDRLARAKDIAPKRLLTDDALIQAARALPQSVPALEKIPGFHSKLIRRESVRWIRAVKEAVEEKQPVPFTTPSTAPPPLKAWEPKRPAAASLYARARPALAQRAQELGMPVENLLTPDHLRRLCWDHAEASAAEWESILLDYGARPWQVEQVRPVLAALQ